MNNCLEAVSCKLRFSKKYRFIVMQEVTDWKMKVVAIVSLCIFFE